MEQKLIKGVLPAIFSVYDKDRNVIKETIDRLVKYHLDNGMTGFYVGGNTGECAVLPNKTRMQMLETVKKANNGKGKIIAHVGSGNIDDVYELIDHANELGVDAVASLPPALSAYYEMDEIIEYYRIIAKRSKAPLFAYVTGVLQGDILGFAKKVFEIDNVVGIKMSIPDYYTFGKITAECGERLNVLNGPDETLICGLMEGADGAIGTTYNMLPKLSANIYNEFKKGNNLKALDLQRKMNRVIDLLISANTAEWKAVMTLMGYDMGYTIEPQRLPDENYLKVLKEKLEEIEFFDLI